MAGLQTLFNNLILIKEKDWSHICLFYLHSTPCGILENPATSSVSRGSTEMDDTIDPRVTIIKPASPKLEIHNSRSWGTREFWECEWERRRDRISFMYLYRVSTDLFWRLGGLVQQTTHQDSERQKRLGELQWKVGVECPELSSFVQIFQAIRGRLEMAFSDFRKRRPHQFLTFRMRCLQSPKNVNKARWTTCDLTLKKHSYLQGPWRKKRGSAHAPRGSCGRTAGSWRLGQRQSSWAEWWTEDRSDCQGKKQHIGHLENEMQSINTQVALTVSYFIHLRKH